MRRVEREITRFEYACNILKNNGIQLTEDSDFHPINDIKNIQGHEETVLITKIFNNYKYEAWHPTLGEFDIMNGVPPKKDYKQKQQLAEEAKEEPQVVPPQRYSEVNVILKIKTFAPLSFEAVLKKDAAPVEEAKNE